MEGDYGVDVAHADVGGDDGGFGCVVEDGADVCVDQAVDDFLGDWGRDGEDGDVDLLCGGDFFEVGEVVDEQAAGDLADEVRVGVERADDAEAFWFESGIVDDGASEASDADDGDVPGSVEPEDLAQLGEEVGDAVAASLFAEASEVAEVFADLGWGGLQEFAELLGANDFEAALFEVSERAKVSWQALDDDFGNVWPGGYQAVSLRGWGDCEVFVK